MKHHNTTPPPEIEPITEAWIHQHAHCITWEQPLFRRRDKWVSVWQIGIAQGTNVARRRDPHAWFVVVRNSRFHERRHLARPDMRILTTLFFDTHADAQLEVNVRKARMLQQLWSTRCDPMIAYIEKEIVPHGCSDGHIATLAAANIDVSFDVIMQPLFSTRTPRLHVWRDTNANIARAIECHADGTSSEVALSETVANRVLAILRHYTHTQNVVLLCDMDRGILYVYDVFCAANNTDDATTTSLSQRLCFLRDAVHAERREHMGVCVDVIPMQHIPAHNSNAWRQHLRIYCSSMHFPAVLCRADQRQLLSTVAAIS